MYIQRKNCPDESFGSDKNVRISIQKSQITRQKAASLYISS